MAQQEKIVLWIDRRWLTAIEKRLNGQTLQEHMEDVLDELCNHLPEREYKRISAARGRALVKKAQRVSQRAVRQSGQQRRAVLL